ncbi:MAG: adenylate cyclase [bacterium P3]|nr:MAG: adenylate cyclase [bacterium P3]KWW42293.1 MAG: adenylate cyclase [bacterium F083]
MQKMFLKIKYMVALSLLTAFAAPLLAQPDKVYRSLGEVSDPQQVYRLRLRWKRLRAVPPEVFTFTNLRELDLSRNNIDSIPPDIARLPHLQKLVLGRNLIRRLPIEIALLGELQHLDLNRNPVEELPDDMAYMPSLRELVLWSTNITALPASFVELNETLQLLDLRSCSLSHDEQQAIELLLPSTRKLWDHACNCR